MYILRYFLIVVLSFFLACNKCGDIPVNNVKIRFHNELGFDLVRITSGGVMNKGVDSYRSCSLDVAIEDLKDGEVSDYQTTQGNHLGYNNVRITWRRTEGNTTSRPSFRKKFDDELIRNGAVQDSIANVFTGKMIHGLRLPDGNYTYKLLGLSNSENTVDVEIIRD